MSQTNIVWASLSSFKNLLRSIQRYKASKDHVYNSLNLKNVKINTVSVLDVITEHVKLFKLLNNENVWLYRLCMEHLI